MGEFVDKKFGALSVQVKENQRLPEKLPEKGDATNGY